MCEILLHRGWMCASAVEMTKAVAPHFMAPRHRRLEVTRRDHRRMLCLQVCAGAIEGAPRPIPLENPAAVLESRGGKIIEGDADKGAITRKLESSLAPQATKRVSTVI